LQGQAEQARADLASTSSTLLAKEEEVRLLAEDVNATRSLLSQEKAQVRLLSHEQGVLRADHVAQKSESKVQAERIRISQEQGAHLNESYAHTLRQLSTAEAEVAKLNGSHAAIAKELGLTLNDFKATAAKEVADIRQMHERLGEADDELERDRTELGQKMQELNATQTSLKGAQHDAKASEAMKRQLAKAHDMIAVFRQVLQTRDAELQQTKASLAAASAKAAELQDYHTKLGSAEEELGHLHSLIRSKARELNATRAQMNGAVQIANQLKASRESVTANLAVTNKQLNLTQAELNAEDGELGLMRKELNKTLAVVKDLKDMHTRLDVAGKELKAYQRALTDRTSELGATRGKLAHAKDQRAESSTQASAVIQDIEQMKAKLRLESQALVSLSSGVRRSDLQVRGLRR